MGISGICKAISSANLLDPITVIKNKASAATCCSCCWIAVLAVPAAVLPQLLQQQLLLLAVAVVLVLVLVLLQQQQQLLLLLAVAVVLVLVLVLLLLLLLLLRLLLLCVERALSLSRKMILLRAVNLKNICFELYNIIDAVFGRVLLVS